MDAVKLKTTILLALLRLIARLPFVMLYLLSDMICFVMKNVICYRRKVIMGNLRRSFPDKDNHEIAQIAKEFYRHLSDLIVETVKLLHISNRQLEQHITVTNASLIEQIAADNRPIVIFLGHYGNWEWVQEVTRHYKRPAINAEIYRPVKDKVMDNIMLAVRSRFMTNPIPQKQAIRHLLRMNRDGQQFLVGFIADQRPNSKNLYHWTNFLHQDTAFSTGGEELGRHVNAHFVYLSVEKPRRGHYVMTFREMQKADVYNHKEGGETADVAAYPYTLHYLRLLEESINKAPAYWLWSHNRWKFGRDGKKIERD